MSRKLISLVLLCSDRLVAMLRYRKILNGRSAVERQTSQTCFT